MEFCRLCQVQEGTLNFMENQVFIQKVAECTNINVKQIDDDNKDSLPRKVCGACKLSIDQFHVFLLNVRDANTKLHRHLSNLLLENKKNKSAKATTKTQIKCSSCTKTFTTAKSLEIHKKSHHSNLNCAKCNVKFEDSTSAQNHVCFEVKFNEVSSFDERVQDSAWHCYKCNLKFEDSTSGQNHQCLEECLMVEESQDPETDAADKYGCLLCSQKFDFNYELQDHLKTHGSSFICSYENCKKVCTSIYTLKTHKMKHEGNTPFLCVTCGKAFTTKNSLTCHEKTHAEVKAYFCKECNIGFSVSSNLRTHEKKYHEGRRFYCSQCTRSFITKCSLERHELVHVGLKEFKCQTCTAEFYTKKELTKHERYHQGVRLYKCDRCFKTFFEKHHLTIHIRIHTGERPYVCKVVGCGKTFTESQKLSRHAKARHPTE